MQSIFDLHNDQQATLSNVNSECRIWSYNFELDVYVLDRKSTCTTQLTLQHPTLSQIVTFANGVGVVVEIVDVVFIVDIVDVAVVLNVVGKLVDFVEDIVEIVVL